jgi:hypothetical protein
MRAGRLRQARAAVAAREAEPKPMTMPRQSGPCPQCGRHVVIDRARDRVAHAEPVCAAFERMMSRAGAGDGVEAVSMFGGIVAVPPEGRRS